MRGHRVLEQALGLFMMAFSAGTSLYFWFATDESVTPYITMFVAWMAMWRIALLEQRLDRLRTAPLSG